MKVISRAVFQNWGVHTQPHPVAQVVSQMKVVSRAFPFFLFSTAGKEISPLLLSIIQEAVLKKKEIAFQR